MNWADERYVRLYTRDTPSWRMLPWEAKCILPLLMRKLDRSGILELGEDGLAALSVLIEVPLDVVEPGVDALVRRSTLAWSGNALVMPNFLSAQEVPISDAQRKRDQRERILAKSLENLETVSRAVTPSHAVSRLVTPNRAVPSLAVPIRAEPSVPNQEKKPPAEDARAPGVEDLQQRLCSAFREVRHHPYKWRTVDENALRDVILDGEEEILRRWRIALAWSVFPRCDTVADLVRHWNTYAKAQPRKGHSDNTTDEEFREKTAHLKTDEHGDLVLE